MTEQIKRVEAYSLMDFAVELEKAFLEGYRLNITNDNFPTNFGTLYTAGMVLSDTNTKAGLIKQERETLLNSAELVVEPATAQGEQTEVKRGRKPKMSGSEQSD